MSPGHVLLDTHNTRLNDISQRLGCWWSERIDGAADVRVIAIEPAPSGFSNETWFVDLGWHDDGGERLQRVVLRTEPQGAALFDDCDLDLQYEVMQALIDGGIRVPRLLGREPDAALLGTPFYVMEFVTGKVASGRKPGFHGHGLFFEASVSERDAMWRAAVQAMGQVHRFDWRHSAIAQRFGNPAGCSEAIAGQLRPIESWLAQCAALGPFPVIERGLAWLRANPAEYSDISLLWGDARPGNLIYDGTKVAAILDWEMAGIGPAEFDLFHFLLTDEVVAELNSVPRLAGLPERDETISVWEAAVGRRAENVRHAEIFAATRFAALMALVVRLTPSGLDDPRALLTDNFPTRRLDALLSAS